MKIKAIASICKDDQRMIIIQKDYTEWVGSGRAVYALDGLPNFEPEQLRRVLEIPEKAMKDMAVRDYRNTDEFSELLELADESDVEIFASRTKVYIAGEICHVFFGSTGAMLIPQKLLKPLSDTAEINIFRERYNAMTKKSVLAVTAGLSLVAIIAPLEVSKDMIDEQKRLISYLDMSYNNTKASEPESTEEQLTL